MKGDDKGGKKKVKGDDKGGKKRVKIRGKEY